MKVPDRFIEREGGGGERERLGEKESERDTDRQTDRDRETERH